VTIGDGGGGLYVGPCSQPNHAGKVQSSDGAWWELREDFPHILQFGGVDNGTATDDTAAFEALASYSNAKGRCAYIRPTTFGFATNGIPPSGPVLGGHTFNFGLCGYGTGWACRLFITHPTNRIITSCTQLGAEYSGIQYLATVTRTAEATIYVDAPVGSVTYKPKISHNVFQGGFRDIFLARSTIAEVSGNFSTNFASVFLAILNIDFPDNGDHYIHGNTWDTAIATASAGIIQYNAGGARIIGNKGGRASYAYQLDLIGAATGSTSVLIIEGNSFENQINGAIMLRREPGSLATFDKVIINGNEFAGSETNPIISLDDNSGFISRAIVTNNILQFAGIGIAAYSCKKLLISDNLLKSFGGASVGISLDVGTSGHVGHNEFETVTTPIVNCSPNVTVAA
jgi:hypothetical protein